jgi:peptidyl-prolyl cis-trans isomerase C
MKTTGKTGPLAALRGLAAVAAAASFLAAPALAEDASGDKVVATINGTPITESDLGAAAQAFGEQLQRIPPEKQRSALIDVLIDIRLLAKAAETAGLDKSKDVAPKLAFAHDQTLRTEYLKSKVVASVTDDAAKKRFDEEIAKFIPGDEIHVLHILVKTEDEAKAVIADLDKGGDFAAIAKEKSIDPGSGSKGGDLGFIGKGKTLPEFETAAFALDAGAYSKAPVKSEYGWHVIKVTEKRREPAPTFEAEAPRIRQQIARDTVTNEIKTLRAAAKIDIVPEVPPPAAAAPATPAPGDHAAPAQPAQ